MLINFDGPIDQDWVENLNSVLDDNKKLNLITGEIISMTEEMCVCIESHDLSLTSPATISRCAIVYMSDDMIPVKAQLNCYIKTLPRILEDQVERIDMLANFFM